MRSKRLPSDWQYSPRPRTFPPSVPSTSRRGPSSTPSPSRGCSVPDPAPETAPLPSTSMTSSDPAMRTTLRLGVAGPVGTGKSSIIALICREMSAELQLGVITTDIYTDEDARFLRSAGVLDPERIRAVETGACPHTAIRDDVTANLLAVEDLEADFAPLDVVLVESGGDNLTATFSPALVDAQLFVLDVAGGGDVARKGGPGIGRADLLVVNKTDLGPYVGVDVPQMVADGQAAREGRPVIGLSRLDRASIDQLTGWVRGVLTSFRSGSHVAVDPGPMAPHSHADEGGTAHVHRHEGGHHEHTHTDKDKADKDQAPKDHVHEIQAHENQALEDHVYEDEAHEDNALADQPHEDPYPEQHRGGLTQAQAHDR